MLFAAEWGMVAPASLGLVGGIVGGALCWLFMGRRAASQGIPVPRDAQSALAISLGLLVAMSIFTLDFLLTRPPRALEVSHQWEPDPSWQTSTLSVGMAAPDFTLPDLRSERSIHFSTFRAGRPAVLLFGSFG